MTPDYEKAAIKATETLIKYGISTAPVDPLPILKKIPGVLVVSYETMSNDVAQSRSCVLSMFGDNRDAFTSVNFKNGKPQYLVTYNQRLPFHLVQRALARELGHIILGHDGSRTDEVRTEEAICFANHLLCPRPLIHTVQSAGVRITLETLVNLTGCYHHCLACMRRIPPLSISADLNRVVRDQFMDYAANFIDYELSSFPHDSSEPADFGTYMEGYEE